MKNTRYYFLLLCFTHCVAHAQNLVPNPSFENLKKAASCDLSIPKADFESIIYDWEMPTNATPDIYSTLLPSTCIASQPNSSVVFGEFPTGHQLPRTGNLMAGFAPYISVWYSEYLSVKLTSPLVVGERYCCRMYVSLAEGCSYAQNNLGMYFSVPPVFEATAPHLSFSPQLLFEEVIEDSINWVELKGSFTATNTAQYLLIGNFNSSGLTQVYQGPRNASFAYYFVDDVSVELLNAPPVVITGNRKVCPRAPLQLNATGWENIQWFDAKGQVLSNQSTFNIAHAKNTNYTVKGYYCSALLSQTVTVEVLPLPPVDLGADQFICRGGNLTLDAGAGYASYMWEDGSTSSTYTAHHEGLFSVTVSSNDGCYHSDTIALTYYQNPHADLGTDFETCTPVGNFIASKGLSYETYLWQDGSTLPYFAYTQEGSYSVAVSNPCFVTDIDTITIYKIELFIPNLITPNDDGLNDEFKMGGLLFPRGKLEIYNSYGARVYQQEQYDYTWSGKGLSDGIYYYTFQYPSCENRNGWIQVIK